jgi:hypothetical protein
MGTDIHLQVEVKDLDAWKICPRKPFPRYNEPGFTWKDDPTSRNYDLFAFLANVRNGIGFAGVITGARIEPQFPGRGFPADYQDPRMWFEDHSEDMDEEALVLATATPKRPYGEYPGGDFWIGDHSVTHATLKELQDCNWGLTVTSTGFVTLDQYLKYRAEGAPDEWCGDVGGHGVVKFEGEHALELFEAHVAKIVLEIKALKDSDSSSLDEVLRAHPKIRNAYVRIAWDWTPLSNCAFKRWIFGDVMQGIAAEFGGPENVRVIIGFDS